MNFFHPGCGQLSVSRSHISNMRSKPLADFFGIKTKGTGIREAIGSVAVAVPH